MTKHSTVLNVRTRSHNFISFVTGTKQNASQVICPLEYWNSFMNNNILGLLVQCTNTYITKTTKIQRTNETEIKTLVSFFISYWKYQILAKKL